MTPGHAHPVPPAGPPSLLRPPSRRLVLTALAGMTLAGCSGRPPTPTEGTPSRSAPATAAPTTGGRTDGGSTTSRRRPLAVVYRGPAACDGCAESAADAIRARGVCAVGYVGPGEERPLTRAALAEAALYVQPGGGTVDEGWAVMRDHDELIRSWVHDGGSYLGLCLGGYLAADDPGFGIFPGDIWDYASVPGGELGHDRPAILGVRWGGSPVDLYVQDPCVFQPRRGADVEVLATYSTGEAAAVTTRYGAGRVTLVGPHPEADRSWFVDDGLRPPAARPAWVWESLEVAALGRLSPR